MTAPKRKQTYHKIRWKQGDHDVGLLLDYLEQYLETRGRVIKAIAMVMRGGGVPGTLIAYATGITDVGTICITSYDRMTQTKPEIKHDLVDTIKALAGEGGEHLLVVDDLADGGETMRVIRERYPKAIYVAPYVKSKESGRAVLDAWAVQIPATTWYAFPWSKREPNSAVVDPGAEVLAARGDL